MQQAHHWIIGILDDLIEYAERHDLPMIATALLKARDSIGAHLALKHSKTFPQRAEQGFRQLLEDLLEYCRSHRLDEVVTHLQEAKAAWERARQPKPASNVITFPVNCGEAPGTS